MARMKKIWDRVPEAFKEMITKLACESDITILDKAIRFLSDHSGDYLKSDSLISEEVFLEMVETLFGGAVILPLHRYPEEVWERNERYITNIIVEVSRLINQLRSSNLIYEHRTKECLDNSDDMVALCQNMHLYLAYYFYHKRAKELYKRELIEILNATQKNMIYVLSFSEDEATLLLHEESPITEDDFIAHGMEPWSEPLASLYHEFDSEEVVPIYERYVDFLQHSRYNVAAKIALDLQVLPKVRKRLKRLYLDSFERLQDEIAEEEEHLIKLCKKRKKLKSKIHNIELFDEEYLPF